MNYSVNDIDKLKRDVWQVLCGSDKKGTDRLYRPGEHMPRKDKWAAVKVLEMLEEVRKEVRKRSNQLPPSPSPRADTMPKAQGRAQAQVVWREGCEG